MLPGVKFSGEEIVRAALALVREQGGYAPCPRRHQGAWLRGCRAAHPLRKHRAVHSYARSVFAPEPDYKTRCVIFRILIVLAAAYAAYLLRRLPPLTSGESCVRMEKNTEGD